jgi:hypothetical protein
LLCAAILGVACTTAPAAMVEWHLLGAPPSSPPSSLVLSPAAPTTADTISFIAPTDGEGGFNAMEAAALYGNPLISVDSINRIVTVTFTAPVGGPIPLFALPVGGVDGRFGPLGAGTWVFKILTNSYTFIVAGPPVGPPLGIAPAGHQLVMSWTASASNYVLQASTDLSSGSWTNVTSGITTDGTTCFFTSAVSNRAAFFRLKSQ